MNEQNYVVLLLMIWYDKHGIHYCDECDGYMIVRYNRNEEVFLWITNFEDKNIKCQNSYGMKNRCYEIIIKNQF